MKAFVLGWLFVLPGQEGDMTIEKEMETTLASSLF